MLRASAEAAARRRRALTAAALLVAACGAATAALAADYVFGWPFVDSARLQPRGGVTRGAAVELATSAGPQRDPGAPGLTAFERDRRAILAMAGPHRASFDFLETMGFAADYAPARPYRSWGTELVFVLADEGTFISLQHILVQTMLDDAGDPLEPVVIKHWRQDWTYEDRVVVEHVGAGEWRRRELPEAAVSGTWSQAVFHVDDSPRYESWGSWRHDGGFSVWQSGTTRRPLPRREFSVRDDYDLLVGTNRHTVLPLGWTHEQDNLKAVLGADGALRDPTPFLAREIGLNRYERIVDHDFAPATAYWDATHAFWADVRAAWERLFATHARFVLRRDDDGRALTMKLFGYAQQVAAAGSYDRVAGRAAIDALMRAHVQSGDG